MVKLELASVFRNPIEADRLHLQDDESVFGHIFISFISLYVYSKIEIMLKKADLLKKYSAKDVLLELSKIYWIGLNNEYYITEVSRKLEILLDQVGIKIFPKMQS